MDNYLTTGDKIRGECIQALQQLLSNPEFASDCSSDQDLCQLLSNGEILCTVLTQLSEGRISSGNETCCAINSPIIAKRNLNFFVEKCQEEFGMREDELFEPDDLLTMSNPEKVVSSIHKLVSKSGQVVPKPKRQSNISVGGGMMDKIIKEICDHEKALVDKLTKLLLYRQELLGLLSEWSEEFVEVVFRHTEQLYLVHKEFHEKLSALADQGCEQFCMQLPDLYNELAPKLEVYKNYFSDLPTAEEIMKDGFKKTPSLQIQLKLLERHFNNGCTGLGFRALFEAPIRQTTSYLMLFERLQKAAEKDIPDAAPCVGEIVAAMQDFLDKTNEYKKQAEQLAATKEILRQIQQLPTDLGNPTLIGLHLGNDSFKVKTVKSGKVESIICACILTTKQLIVANKPPRKDGQSTYAFNIPVDTIMEVRKCEKTFALELIQNDGDRVTLECLKRSKDLLSLWKKLLDETKSLNLPNGWNSNGHRFQLITIPEGTKCTKCYQPLPSSVMQGYSCSHCSQTVHIHCFQLVGAARRGTAPALPTQHLAVAAYHKNVTRQRAHEILSNTQPGAYLIRDGKLGCKVLSLHTGNGKFEHISIEEEGGKVALGNKICWFDDLDKMVQFYADNNLSIHFSMIDCHLTVGMQARAVKRFLPRHATVDETV